jgi:hypothetical protein
MPIPFEDQTKYIAGAIDALGYIQNLKATEAIRSDIISNYGGQFATSVLRESISRHASLMVKKSAEPVAQPAPVVQQNQEAVNAHVKEILRQLSEEFPTIDFYTSAHNNRLLGDFVDAQGGNLTMATLRTGVRLLLTQLEQKAPPPPPEPEPEPEVLRILSDGQRQLPLECSEADIREASKLQLKDWLARKDTKKYGGFDGRL